MIRRPAVAGHFYPSSPEALKKQIASFGVQKPKEKEKALACILPHAGYMYSGKVAASVLSGIEVADTCIILGPNHTGDGVPYSLQSEGKWLSPFGEITINTRLAELILKNSRYLQEDFLAHENEHSIEVELPLIQEICRKDFTFVPIILASADDLVYKDISNAIYKSISALKQDVTIIASSDMTHYEPQANAAKKDNEAIKAILKLDEKELLDTIQRLKISMCGYMPVVVALMSAKLLGAKKARLIAYQTSGDVTGDYSAVVGYAGIVIQ
jgi:hypothetical protein